MLFLVSYPNEIVTTVTFNMSLLFGEVVTAVTGNMSLTLVDN